MFFLGWHPDYMETSNFLAPWTTESPESMGTYFNHHPNYEAYKHIIEVAAGTVDTTQRGKLYQAIQILTAQDVPFLPLWAMTYEMVTARLPNVKGLFIDPSMNIHIAGIWKE